MIKAVDRIHGRNEFQSPNNQLHKRSTLLSPLKAFSGCFLLSLVLLSILGVFFLSSPSPFSPSSKLALSPPPPHTNIAVIAEPHTDKCDLFKGKWVPDHKGPLYNTTNCLTLPDAYNCFKNGRKDADFFKWRWKPDECDLPRFDPSAFLELVHGKKLAFVGDSLARNHMESLLCLLSQAETPLDVYKDTKDRFRTWNFPSSNFTLMVLWAKFLVKHEEQLVNGSNSGSYNLHIDKMDDAWASELHNLDYVVLSLGHWLFRKNCLYNKTEIIGCIYNDDPSLVQSLSVEDAMKMVLRSALSYIDSCEECGDVVTVVRTFSPGHFENGAWNKGGYCNWTRPIGKVQGERMGKFEMELRRLQIEELERVKSQGRRSFMGLDVTGAMLVRPDGHPGSYWPGKEWTNGCDDCIHWCMPGPVDAWSHLLMTVLLRQVDHSSSFIIH